MCKRTLFRLHRVCLRCLFSTVKRFFPSQINLTEIGKKCLQHASGKANYNRIMIIRRKKAEGKNMKYGVDSRNYYYSSTPT